MKMDLFELLPVEREALLEALRRDLRSESQLALNGSSWQIWHQRNVQLTLRILEALNPKRRDIAKHVSIAFLAKPASLEDSKKGPREG